MAQNVTIAGASYPAVPSVEFPKTGGGTASFFDISATTAAAADVVSGETFYSSSGTQTTGTLVVQKYYTGSTAPSSSLGNDGDIYIQQ